MSLRSVIEPLLALGAVLLLARDMHRAWLDQLRRPITLLVAAMVAALLVGTMPATMSADRVGVQGTEGSGADTGFPSTGSSMIRRRWLRARSAP